MKIIRIKTDNSIDVLQFPETASASMDDNFLERLIGETCDIAERVRPRRLYEEFGAGAEATRFKGDAVSMLVDEMGISKNLPVNLAASWLYGADVHGCPIVGDVLIVGEYWHGEGISFCGLSEYNYWILFDQLQLLTELVRRSGCLNMANE